MYLQMAKPWEQKSRETLVMQYLIMLKSIKEQMQTNMGSWLESLSLSHCMQKD